MVEQWISKWGARRARGDRWDTVKTMSCEQNVKSYNAESYLNKHLNKEYISYLGVPNILSSAVSDTVSVNVQKIRCPLYLGNNTHITWKQT